MEEKKITTYVAVSTEYAVVRFLKSKNRGLQDVELVPESWITKTRKEWKCSYLPEEDYHLMGQWVEESKLPEKHWKSFAVEILSECRKYIAKNVLNSRTQ